MTADLVISKKNEVYLHIECEPHVQYELRDAFSFEVPGAKFHPSYRKRHWDGVINLFSPQTKQIYVGLLDRVVAFCEQYGYSYEFRDNKFYGLPYEENENISPAGVADWVKTITSFKPRDYQLHGIYTALKSNRKTHRISYGIGKVFDDLCPSGVLLTDAGEYPNRCSHYISCRADV